MAFRFEERDDALSIYLIRADNSDRVRIRCHNLPFIDTITLFNYRQLEAAV